MHFTGSLRDDVPGLQAGRESRVARKDVIAR
jgi:hypothetical protein